MKKFGIAILIIGVIGAIASMAMDVSVATPGGMRVNNIGLMADRQNYLIISGFVAIAGLLLTLFGDRVSLKSVEHAQGTTETDPNASRLDGVPVKMGLIIFLICFAFVIGSILFFRR
ncbi:hypothetical protein ACRPHP_16450 [Pantoea allii]|uniref:hypothetical protein n=1 Tax=Pantoea allii TaxID=574096 RepID=UPI003D7B6E80